jgi:tetratricopeptide (TPR) repeat protein
MTSQLLGPRHHLTRMFLVLVWTVLAGALPSTGQDASGTEEHLAEVFSQAQAAQQQGDYRTAADYYEEIVKLRPDVAEAWANLGLMHQFLEEYPQADHNFQVALRKNPRLSVPNLFLGLNRLRARQPAIALRYLKVAESLTPKDEQAAMGLARAYQASHDDTGASRWFSRATEINPGDPDAWYGLGIAYLSLQDAAVVQLVKLGRNGPYARSLVADAFVVQGRIMDALNIYNKLLASPTQPPCLLAALGFAYAQQDSDLARKTFEDALKKNPGCLATRLGLARLAVTKGDFAEALNEVHTAWDADHNFVRANLQRIWKGADPDQLNKAAAWLRQNASSQDTFAQFLAQSIESGGVSGDVSSESNQKTNPASVASQNTGPQSPESLWTSGHYTACEAKLQRERAPAPLPQALLLAQCSYYSGNYRASLTASEGALKIDAQSELALYWKAKSSQGLATDALERMSATAPGSAKVQLLLAELHRAREEFGAAETEYTQVINSGSNDPAAHLGLAQVYYQESQDDKALQQLQFVLQADSTNPQGSFLMGQVLVRRHQYAEATPYLKTALKGSPLSFPQVHSLLARCLAAQGDYSSALVELKPALPSDTTGIFHYQLYQIYKKLGDEKGAAAALQESERFRREEAAAEERQKMMRQNSHP